MARNGGKAALAVLVLALLAPAGCVRERPGPVDLAAVAAAVEQSRACADELGRAAGEDADAVARAIEAEPGRLALYPRYARGVPVRDIVTERLEAARAGAAAAEVLSRIAVEDRAGPSVEERAAASLRIARGLCRSADRVRAERLAVAR